jgi:cytochrome c oxidase subunit 4
LEFEGVMSVYVLLNLGSLLLGLVAWLLPLINLAVTNKAKNTNWLVLSIASVSACAVSLCMQLFYNAHLVRLKDWGALTDIADAVANVSLVLLVVTIVLNAIAVIVYRKHRSGGK